MVTELEDCVCVCELSESDKRSEIQVVLIVAAQQESQRFRSFESSLER